MPKLASLIKNTNARLRHGGVRLTIEARGNWLWARGTLPPRGNDQARPYQQRFALGCPATPIGLHLAEQKIKVAGANLSLDQFNWGDWITDAIANPQTAGDWVRKFEIDYWRKRPQSPSARSNWRIYAQVFRKLPDRPLTLDLLVGTLAQVAADTRARQRGAMVLGRLAIFAGLPPEPLRCLAGNYSAASVEPRFLPTDAEIEQAIDAIHHPGWRWIAAMMATYGLRNHEVFHLHLGEYPTIWVEDATKTGKRFVYPLHPEWCDRWELDRPVWPKLQAMAQGGHFDWDNSRLGAKISRWFAKRMPCKPYDLRHSYARRCFEHQFPADLTAKLMGHSLQMQAKTYRAWWGEATYRRLYQDLLAIKASP